MKSPSCVGKLCETCLYQRVCDRKVDLFTYRKPREYIRREYCSVEISGESYIGELIRCRDCMWYTIDELKADGTADMRYSPSFCIYWRTHTNKDDYCSNGKKAEYGTGND